MVYVIVEDYWEESLLEYVYYTSLQEAQTECDRLNSRARRMKACESFSVKAFERAIVCEIN